MSNPALSADERRQLALCRIAIWLLPIITGLVTASVFAAARDYGYLGTGAWPLLVFLVNTTIAAVGAAIAVVLLHPVQRGKWWRAGAATLFAIVFSYAVFGVCAKVLKAFGVYT